MFKYLLAFIVDYYLIQFLYYWFHRWIHLPSSGIFYKIHFLGHHKRDFPLRQLRKDSYSKDGSGGWFQTGGELVFGLPIILLSIVTYFLVNVEYFIIFEICLIMVLFIGEFTHSSFHLTNTATSHPESLFLHNCLTRMKIFYEYQYLHDLHHSYKTANFGFFDMTMDRIFGTYNTITPFYLEKFKINK